MDTEEIVMFSMQNTKKYLSCVGVAAISSLAMVAAPAHAQSAYDDGYGYSTSGVTVYARPYDRDPATGADIDIVRASRVVYTRDLDLSTDWGMHALNVRIDRAAREACDEIDSRYGGTTLDDDATCVRRAADRAKGDVQDALYYQTR
jgi:UrcA family protein